MMPHAPNEPGISDVDDYSAWGTEINKKGMVASAGWKVNNGPRFRIEQLGGSWQLVLALARLQIQVYGEYEQLGQETQPVIQVGPTDREQIADLTKAIGMEIMYETKAGLGRE